MLPIISTLTLVVASSSPKVFSSPSLNCFSLPADHGNPVKDLIEGVLQEKLDSWLKIAFGQENPFLGTEGGAGCSREDCVVQGVKLLGNFSGPFQIEVTFRTELLL